ncbi:MAG: protein-S-isoprenylcysteine O-methyltransferase [Bacteroidota bacterium]
MSTLTIKILFSIFWLATGFIRSPFARRNKSNTITTDNKTGVEKMTLFGTMLGLMLLPLVYLLTPLLAFADYELPSFAPFIGVALMPFTLWLFYRSHYDLGRNWSVSLEIREGHHIVDTGVYRHIRHPMYTAIWLWCIIQALMLHNYLAGLGGLVGFGLLYVLRVDEEEAMMLREFGPAYESYKRRTKRLIPFLF